MLADRAYPVPLARGLAAAWFVLALAGSPRQAVAQPLPTVPPNQRGGFESERSGTHDAANIRTVFWNFGMVGDYPSDPGNVDLSVFHSVEVPKGTGMNYSDGITPFVLAKFGRAWGIRSSSWRPASGSVRHRAHFSIGSCASSRGRDTSNPIPPSIARDLPPSATTPAPGRTRGPTG